MQPNVEYYQGREQSYIKHLFLQKYLDSAAYKLFQGRSPVFNFVDAFAGPWRNTDMAKQTDTSFALALNVTIMARDAESFRQSRTQVAADIARAVSLGRRGM